MGLFSRRDQYDRTRLLREARKELRKAKFKRALPPLRSIMAREPDNPELHALIAPALAARRHGFEAWESYQTAIRALYKHGKKEAALELHTDATRRLPHIIETWVRRAELERELNRRDDAEVRLHERVNAQAVPGQHVVEQCDLAVGLAENGVELRGQACSFPSVSGNRKKPYTALVKAMAAVA